MEESKAKVVRITKNVQGFVVFGLSKKMLPIRIYSVDLDTWFYFSIEEADRLLGDFVAKVHHVKAMIRKRKEEVLRGKSRLQKGGDK